MRVLLIEDDDSVARSIELMLKAAGFNIYTTDMGEDGVDLGKVYEYDIDLWATSNTFLPGHRIRVEIASSNFPRFDRNLNTGEDPATATRMQTAHQVVYHSAQYPSHIVLPIIPRSSHPTG